MRISHFNKFSFEKSQTFSIFETNQFFRTSIKLNLVKKCVLFCKSNNFFTLFWSMSKTFHIDQSMAFILNFDSFRILKKIPIKKDALFQASILISLCLLSIFVCNLFTSCNSSYSLLIFVD